MKTIYNLQLHERLNIDKDILITKVPGGWIYELRDTDGWNAVFVPYNVEFDPKYIEK